MDAVKQWKFKPYIKGGKAVKVKVTLPVDFAFANQIKDGAVSATTAPTDTQDPLQRTTTSSNAQAQPAPHDSTGPAPTRVRISQKVTSGLLVHRVNPIYPTEAKKNHVQGRVLLNTVIGTDGNIKDLQVASGPKELVDAAVGAVQQWRYRPYQLKGQPIEVETTIEMNFQLAR